jgi:hypothetical protein
MPPLFLVREERTVEQMNPTKRTPAVFCSRARWSLGQQLHDEVDWNMCKHVRKHARFACRKITRIPQSNFLAAYVNRVILHTNTQAIFDTLPTKCCKMLIWNLQCPSVRPSVRPSARPHIATRETLNGFLWNFMLKRYSKLCRHIPILVKIGWWSWWR